MSAFGDAFAAIRSIILIEERVRNQGAKLEKVADMVFDLDRRLVRVETAMDLLLRRLALNPLDAGHFPGRLMLSRALPPLVVIGRRGVKCQARFLPPRPRRNAEVAK